MAKPTKPKLPIEHAKSRKVTVRFRTSEYKRIEGESFTVALSTAEYIRRKVLETPLPSPRLPELNQSVCLELGKIGNNINQLVHLLHQGRIMSAPAKDFERLRVLLLEVKQCIAGRPLDDPNDR